MTDQRVAESDGMGSVFSATMRVANLGTRVGRSDNYKGYSYLLRRGMLSEDHFRHDGKGAWIWSLAYSEQDSRLVLLLSSQAQPGLRLQVGGWQFSLSSADVVEGRENMRLYEWDAQDLGWEVGDELDVNLVRHENRRPNVVLILADDFGWGDVSSNNPDSAMTTPNIDSIAQSGINFLDAHASAAACSPTRYSLLTGRYSWRSWMKTEVLNGYDRPLIGSDVPTLATLLSDNGYRTGIVGKWHVGLDFARLDDIEDVHRINRGIDFDGGIVDGPLDHGFDEFWGMSANHTWPVPVYLQDRGFSMVPEGTEQPAVGNMFASQILESFTDRAVSFIDRAVESDEPFFLYMPVNTPHVPLAPGQGFVESTDMGLYGDVIAETDWSVGQVLDAIERGGELENTLVIFTSDNGSDMNRLPADAPFDHTRRGSGRSVRAYSVANHQSNGPWRDSKGSTYEGGHRVPLFMQWPDYIVPGERRWSTVALNDIYATFAEILGVEVEEGTAIDSVSMYPMLRDDSATRGVPVVHLSSRGNFAIREGDWKYIEQEPKRLFNLRTDPGESNNRYWSEPEIVEQLKASLEEIRDMEDGNLSSDATLRSLVIAGIDYGEFDPEVESYTAHLAKDVETVEVIAFPTQIDSTIHLATSSGDKRFGFARRGRLEIGLGRGDTTIRAIVTAPDRKSKKTYTVTIGRAQEPSIIGIQNDGIPKPGVPLSVDTDRILHGEFHRDPELEYQWIVDDEEVEGATDATFTPTESELGKTIKVRVGFTDDGGMRSERTSAATEPVGVAVTSYFDVIPASHDGESRFYFELHFSEEMDLLHMEIRQHAFTLEGGEVVNASRPRRGRPGQNMLWHIWVEPDGDGDIYIALPPTEDCDVQGAICAEDGRMLLSHNEITVAGPGG